MLLKRENASDEKVMVLLIPRVPFPYEVISFYLCDLKPTGVDHLWQPVPDLLEPERAAWQSWVTSSLRQLGLQPDLVT